MTYLSRSELAALTGSPLRRRQVAWLCREGWPNAIGWDGWPRVELRDGMEAARLLLAHTTQGMTQQYVRASNPVRPA